MTLPRRARAGLVVLALAAGACAPPPPGGELGPTSRAYRVARDHREALVRAFTAELVLRISGRATGRLPALTSNVSLAAPDRFRMRVSGLLGVALDVLVRRDSVWAWLPSRRTMFVAPSDSLGVRDPAALAGLVLGATWNPPESAWSAATSDSDGWSLAWREGDDSLALVVDAKALPRRAWIGRTGHGVSVRYEAWGRVSGEPFPARVSLEDDTGWARVRLECDDGQSRAEAPEKWFAPRRGAAERTLG
ncbi:MAG TPA: hypothetical protein VMH61_01545, partial [Candidatus Acidoferrales bacterium]|nr:hypothetical protein [Candidatus Acidoferrales bacterium]